MNPYSSREDVRLVRDERSSAVIGRHSNVLKDVSADEEVRVVSEGIEGVTDLCQGCERVEGVEQVDIRHRDCNRTKGFLQEEDMFPFFGGGFSSIGCDDGRCEWYLGEAGLQCDAT